MNNASGLGGAESKIGNPKSKMAADAEVRG